MNRTETEICPPPYVVRFFKHFLTEYFLRSFRSTFNETTQAKKIDKKIALP